MAKRWWSSGGKDRRGISSTNPLPKDVAADLLSMVVTKRGGRKEKSVSAVEMHDFVPPPPLLALMDLLILPNAKASAKSKLQTLSKGAKSCFDDSLQTPKKNTFYRNEAGETCRTTISNISPLTFFCSPCRENERSLRMEL